MTEPKVDVLREIFRAAPFVAAIGMALESVSAGECATSLDVRGDHLQQNGVVHAGVVATMADHTAGGAASSLLEAGHYPLTVEFKINLLRPATTPRLLCRANVLKAGRTIVVAESEVFGTDPNGHEQLVAKAMVTLAVVARSVPT